VAPTIVSVFMAHSMQWTNNGLQVRYSLHENSDQDLILWILSKFSSRNI